MNFNNRLNYDVYFEQKKVKLCKRGYKDVLIGNFPYSSLVFLGIN